MSTGTARGPRSRTWGIGLIGLAAAVVAAVAGQYELAELTGGALSVWGSVVLGMRITPRVAIEIDPGRLLKLDLLLVLVVALGLFGVTLIGLAVF